MKNTILLVAAALLAVGCDQQRQAKTETSSDSEKSTIRDAAKGAKQEVEKQARAEKDRLDAEAKAATAQIDAETARAKAAATDAQSKVEAASQSIRDAAGAASDKAQREVGAEKSTPPPSITPSEPGAIPVTPTPSTPAAATTAEADRQLEAQVRNAISGGTEAYADAAKDLQITASGGIVTVKGNVKSEAEKTRIESAAKAVPGANQVVISLEVKE